MERAAISRRKELNAGDGPLMDAEEAPLIDAGYRKLDIGMRCVGGIVLPVRAGLPYK